MLVDDCRTYYSGSQAGGTAPLGPTDIKLQCSNFDASESALGHEHASRLPHRHGVSASVTGRELLGRRDEQSGLR